TAIVYTNDGTYDGAVFKIPNKSKWSCFLEGRDLECEASTYFRLYQIAASLKNGLDVYGRMNVNEFGRLMGNKPIVKCDDDLNPLSGNLWEPLRAPACSQGNDPAKALSVDF